MTTRNLPVLLLAALFIFFSLINCGDDEGPDYGDRDFKQDMRNFVQGISTYAKGINPDFIIIPQNGHELVSDNGDTDGNPKLDYIAAIDALGQEDLYYGYYNDDEATPAVETEYLTDLIDKAKDNDKVVLVIDYCWTHSKMDDSYRKNAAKGYISFAADSRELDDIPDYPFQLNNANSDSIDEMNKVKNFLYLINPAGFPDKTAFINAVRATNYDLVIMDYFFDEEVAWTQQEVSQLRQKANGGIRLVISYMSIGEAENYRYYWQSSWESNPPEWMAGENPEWEGNYKVLYWMTEWQSIIYGNNESYLKKILDTGFDGAYLDIIDAFEYFE